MAGTGPIVVVGSTNMDLIAYTPKLPAPGETVMGKTFEQGFGGKGANQAVLLGKLGANVSMVTKVGADSFGTDHIANYKANGVDATHVSVAEAGIMTGVAPISVDAQGENCIIVCPGANMAMTTADVDAAKSLFEGAKVVVCQNEIPLAVTARALELGKQAGALTLWSVAPCPPEAKDYPMEMFKNVDILCVNQMEAEQMGGLPALLAKGVNTCLITLGKDGCLTATAEGETRIAGTAVDNVVDTTGAGDAFAGSFAFFKAKGHSTGKAAELANKIAALTVQSKGTQKSYPTKEIVADLLQEPVA